MPDIVDAARPALSAPANHLPGFSSAVTRRPITYSKRWIRDALLQITLDPDISEISPNEFDPSCLPAAAVGVVIVVLNGIRLAVGFVERRPSAWPSTIDGLAFLSLTRSEVLSEPRATAARMVWSRRGTLVSPDDRIRILQAVGTTDGITLLAASEAAKGAEQPVDAVLSLACEGLLALDLSRPITPETRVRRRAIFGAS